MRVDNFINNLSDGIIVLDLKGNILRINDSAKNLLDLKDKKKYSDIIIENLDARNDDFHNLVIDCLNDDQNSNKGNVKYYKNDGSKKYFSVSASILHDDENRKSGVIISIKDNTKEVELHRGVKLASTFFICISVYISFWIFFDAIYFFLGSPFEATIISKLQALTSLIPVFFLFRSSKLKKEDMGLGTKNLKKVIITDSIITIAGLLIMIIIRLFVIKNNPGPLFDFKKYPLSEYFYYFINVFLQEFASRGLMHESLRKIINSDRKEFIAILISSLLFGCLHLHLGVTYMFAAFILLSILGYIYIKQGTIWGMLIPHYILGMALGILGFVAY